MSVEVRTCESEYAKDPKIRKEDIQHLKNWLEKQPHMPKVTEYMLIQFYQACDYSLQYAKSVIEIHYTMKNETPEIFTGLDFQPPKYKHSFFDSIYYIFMPVKTPEGYRVLYIGLQDEDPSKFCLDYIAPMMIKASFGIVFTEGTCPGCVAVVDAQGISFAHMMNLSMSLFRKLNLYVQNASPIKTVHIYIINANMFMEKLMQFAKTFFSKEFMEKIHIYADVENIFQSIPKECIPIDLGGTLPTTRKDLMESMRQRIEAVEKIITEELQLRADDNKKAKDGEDGQTATQSFKQISVD